MPINSFLYPGAKFTPAYEVANSLRFNDGSSDYLNITQSAGNRQIFTYSLWVKRSTLGNRQRLIRDYNGASAIFQIYFESSNDTLFVLDYTDTNPNPIQIRTNQVFRDPSAWCHIVVSIDTTQATSSNRVKIYINGSQVTSFAEENYPSQNFNSSGNQSGNTLYIGSTGSGDYFDGYMAEVCLIDGQQLAADQFGEFDSDTNIWKPINVSGLTFGTNGFYLDFENSGSLGADVSGQANNFTVNNLTSIDQTTDTCTNNFCTLNPLDNDSSTTFSEGNCKAVTDNSLRKPFYSTFGLTQGKWYWEVKMIDVNSSFFLTGISGSFTSTNEPLGYELYDYGYRKLNGAVRNNDSDTSYGSSFADGDIIGIGLDLDNNKLYFAKNGTWENSADPSAGTGGFSISDASNTIKGSYTPAGSDFSTGSGATVEYNFGNPPFSISSGNSDAEGFGNFEYAVPSGYFALCSKNLAEYG